MSIHPPIAPVTRTADGSYGVTLGSESVIVRVVEFSTDPPRFTARCSCGNAALHNHTVAVWHELLPHEMPPPVKAAYDRCMAAILEYCNSLHSFQKLIPNFAATQRRFDGVVQEQASTLMNLMEPILRCAECGRPYDSGDVGPYGEIYWRDTAGGGLPDHDCDGSGENYAPTAMYFPFLDGGPGVFDIVQSTAE